MCMPAGRGLIHRAMDSESGMPVASMLLDAHYRDGVIVNLPDIPAMVLLSAPGVLCTWCGEVRGYGRDDIGCASMHRAMQLKSWATAPTPDRGAGWRRLDRLNHRLGYDVTNVIPSCDPCSLARAHNSLRENIAILKLDNPDYTPFLSG